MSRTRGTWNTKGTWFAGVFLAAVLGLTGYALLTGEEDGGPAPTGAKAPGAASSASPTPTYSAPSDWTEPDRWVALPRGERTDDRGSARGFPRTTEGAVAMMAAANTTRIEGSRSNVDEQLRIYYSYIGEADQSEENAEAIELNGQQADRALATEMGVTPGQVLPAGAYVRAHVVGFKTIRKSADEVTVWLLARVVQKSGETAKEASSYTRTQAGAQWEGGDWKLTSAATERALKDTQGQAVPSLAAPGDEAFNSGGWTAIREAS
ncbi:hypothetical protein [Streptomyces halstedii]|uniref:hypothetical protein n=1 Tax=Streptomyces halstedii TaxID=1944 RepID=UPI0033546DE4